MMNLETLVEVNDIVYEVYNENDECRCNCANCDNRCELGLYTMAQTTTGVGA